MSTTLTARQAQSYTDDTGALRAAVEAAGGLEHLHEERAMQTALQTIEPLLSEVCGWGYEEADAFYLLSCAADPATATASAKWPVATSVS